MRVLAAPNFSRNRLTSLFSTEGREIPMSVKLLPTTVVGSYPQPEWLVVRENLTRRLPPRVRAQEIWRVAPAFLEGAQDDATLLAIRDMERAGIDIITDGEARRESYSNRVATALGGIDTERHGVAKDRSGRDNPVPRVMDKIHRREPIEVRDVAFLRANTERKIKITAGSLHHDAAGPGRFLWRRARDGTRLRPRGERGGQGPLPRRRRPSSSWMNPTCRRAPARAREFALEVLEEALDGVAGTTALHMCFGYAAIHAWQGLGKPDAYSFLPELNESKIDQISIEAAQPRIDLAILEKLTDKTIILGVIDNGDGQVESPENRRRAHPGGTCVRIARAARPRARLRHEIHGARNRLWKAQGAGRGCGHRAPGAWEVIPARAHPMFWR